MLALAALMHVADQAARGPIAPSLWLRALLAHLHEVSGLDRELFDEFWRTVIDDGARAYSETMANTVRGSGATSCWRGIARACGYSETIEAYQAIRKLASNEGRKKQSRFTHQR